MKLDIVSSVGDVMPDGTPSFNSFDDVLVVQFLLNQSGILATPLPLDGEATADLIEAVVAFETSSDAVAEVDGRVDPFDDTWEALHTVALSEFEGVTDRQEQRMIIQRPFPDWSFTRGRFRTLSDLGLEPFFHSSSTWLPAELKNRLLLSLTALLDLERLPPTTYGVHPLDWHHAHLGLWSGETNVRLRPECLDWHSEILTLKSQIDFDHAASNGDLDLFRDKLMQRLHGAEAQGLLDAYAAMPEARMVQHTFEMPNWRPLMESEDVRRNWMVTPDGDILTAPYRGKKAIADAAFRDEFLFEGSLSLCFLLKKTGEICVVPHQARYLDLFTGFDIFKDSLNSPPGPALHP
jgi:hypothetical protein